MNTKILYVLTSTPDDIYLEQAFLSAWSVRHHSPEARITLLTDRLTDGSFDRRGAIGQRFLELLDEKIVLDLDPGLSAMVRSRLLKTSMRAHVSGDFLYLDTDTLAARPLDGIDAVAEGIPDIAACRDSHCSNADNPYREANLGLCRRIGFDLSAEENYFNGGVFLVRDTAGARAFFETWNNLYIKGLEKGVTKDMPSLAQTDAACGHTLRVLDDKWNCELKHGIKFLPQAFIVHYLCTNITYGQDRQLFLLNDRNVLLEVRQAAAPTEAVRAVADDPFAGLADLTHTFAGDDVYFFRTRRYRFARNGFRRGKASGWENLLKLGYRIGNLLGHKK